jgi:aryl-alcohol dehydrogenase-like predicted oxidoreductase
MNDRPRARLGFGTGLPALQSADVVHLLETALDHGVRHIDTAPLYLWGAAEALIGKTASRRRDEMFLVSKAGLQPPRASARVFAKLRRLLSRDARETQPQSGLFAPSQIVASVEASLRALRTDRLNALLMHEIRAHEMSDALAETLRKLKADGKALAIGLATDSASAEAIAQRYPGFFDIAQTAWGDGAHLNARTHIIHSIMARRGAAISTKAAQNSDFAQRFRAATDVDPQDREALGSLLLRAAMADSEGGVALFSTTNPARIAANALLLPLDADLSQRLKPFWSELP